MNSIAQSCDDEPTPEVANVTFSPCFLAKATSSPNVFGARSDLPMNTIGASVTRPIGVNAFFVL